MNAEEANMMLDSAVLRAISAGATTLAAIRARVAPQLNEVAVVRKINTAYALRRSLVRLAPRLIRRDMGTHFEYQLRGHSRGSTGSKGVEQTTAERQAGSTQHR